VKTAQAKTAKKGDLLKVTYGPHSGEKATLMKVKNAGTARCAATVELACGKRTIPNGWLKFMRKAS
jgi:hypothetical protein